MIPKATSITHLHILSVINTESYRFNEKDVIRILDAGCGNGALMGYLQQSLSQLNPQLHFELYGYDVHDHGVQAKGFLDATRQKLSEIAPMVDWTEKVSSISTQDSWPYPDAYFDVVISNQVLEHVGDIPLFFSETNRTLKNGGIAIHLFPLGHYLYESHLNLPLVHKIGNHDLLVKYINLLSRLGMGKYRDHKRKSGVALEAFAERHADYMHYFTHYISYRQALDYAKQASLRASFRYTQEFYSSKVRSVMRRPPRYSYKRNRSGFVDWISVLVLKYLSCVTLFMEKKETYTSR